MKHAAGVRKIMLLRGPGSFQDAFDSAMMLSYKGMLVSAFLPHSADLSRLGSSFLEQEVLTV